MPGTAAGAQKARERRALKSAEDPQRARMMTLREKVRLEAQAQSERSAHPSGLEINLRKIEADDNPSFRELKTRLNALDRMANDAKVFSVLRGNILPLFSAVRATVEGGTSEQRDLIEQNLLRRGDPRFWCETSWLQRILEKCMSLHYGFALHHKTWDVVDGYRIYRRLTYLHPKSLGGTTGPWEWSEDGTRLVAIHRKYRLPNGKQIADERIPIEEIDAAVWWQTGENWEGQSLIRPMYRNWVNKDLASKIGMIALMNGGVGIPMGTLGPGQGMKQGETLKTQAADLRGGDKSRNFLVLENGQSMKFLTTEGNIVDARPMIDEQNMDIAAGGAMDFMQQGQTASGSRAGGSVMMVSYMQQLDAVVRWMEEQINHGAGYLSGLVEELVYENWEQVDDCPRIKLSRVSPTEQLDNLPNIFDAVQKGSLVHDLSVENYVRNALGLPTMSQSDWNASKAQPPTPSLGGRPDSPTPVDQNEPRNDKAGRAFGLAEKKTPDGNQPMRKSACSHSPR